jgi:hypothetical protein
MADKREIDRKRAQARRALAKGAAQQQAEDRRHRVMEAVATARKILLEPSFIDLARACEIKSVPLLLVSSAGSHTVEDANGESEKGDYALDFVVAWRFLFPLFSNSAITGYLEMFWPGFISEFKDTFISLVMYGPFPKERRRPLRANFVC